MDSKCPHCGSKDIQRRAVIEHTTCGCIRPSETFDNGSDAECPECCSGRLSSAELEKTAEFLECRSCEMVLDPTVLDRTASLLSDRKPEYNDTTDLIAEAKRRAKERGSNGVFDSVATPTRAMVTLLSSFTDHSGQEEEQV